MMQTQNGYEGMNPAITTNVWSKSSCRGTLYNLYPKLLKELVYEIEDPVANI